METKTEVDLSTLADDTKLAFVDGDSFALVRADHLKQDVARGLLPRRRVCVPEAHYEVPGFDGADLRMRLIEALEGESVDQAADVVDSLPDAEFEAAVAALDALWEACIKAKKPVYYEETDVTVVFPGCVR